MPAELATALGRWVLQPRDETPGFMGPAGLLVDDPEDAASFGSRLGALTRLETMGKAAMEAWAPVRREHARVHPRAPELGDLALWTRDPLEAVRSVVDLHAEYCERVEAWLRRAGVPDEALDRGMPRCEVTVLAPLWAGCYEGRAHTCHYPLPWAMVDQPQLRHTVAHEVVHAYQRAFTGCRPGHGADFFAMMRHAAGVAEPQVKHTMDPGTARAVSAALRPWFLRELQRGTLSSLPCKVDTTPRKRRAIA